MLEHSGRKLIIIQLAGKAELQNADQIRITRCTITLSGVVQEIWGEKGNGVGGLTDEKVVVCV